MDMPSGKPSLWFTEQLVEDMDDRILWHEFADYSSFLDNNPESEGELPHSLSSTSQSNSSTQATDHVFSNTTTSDKFQEPNNSPISPSRKPNKPEKDHTPKDKSRLLGRDSDSGLESGNEQKRTRKRPKREAEQTQHHIMAERQRRKTLSQGFIALSALIPGLTKMDKTSILGDAINHMKEVKERLRVLEEEKANKEVVESVIVVKRSQVTIANETASSLTQGNFLTNTTCHYGQLPEIEARFYDKSVLIKIHCKKQKGVLIRIISEIENHHLSVTNTTASTFNDIALDIHVTAQVESEFNVAPQEFIKDLHSIFK